MQYFNNVSFTYIHAYFYFHIWMHCSLHSFLEIRIVIIVIIRKEHTLWHPYRTRSRARVMSEIGEVQEKMKGDMEAMKEQMTTMMEAIISMRKMMEADSPIWPQSSKSSSLRYGRSGRQSVGEYRRPSFCVGPEQASFFIVWLASLCTTQCCTCAR